MNNWCQTGGIALESPWIQVLERLDGQFLHIRSRSFQSAAGVHTPKNWNGTRKQLTGLIGQEYHCRRAIEKLDL